MDDISYNFKFGDLVLLIVLPVFLRTPHTGWTEYILRENSGSMVSDRAIFCISGPNHLSTAIDWRNTFHRRSIAASLVQGVYILERDRDGQNGHQGAQPNAPPWWENFHFQLNRVLVDNTDLSFFGAIYELKWAPPHFYYSEPHPPRFVIAFRGTITKSETKLDDFKLNFKFICNKLENCSRFQLAMKEVENLVALAGPANVWLAGHSLGAAIALSVGKNLAKANQHVETYLFNPPFVSAPIEKIGNEKLKHGVRFATSVMTAGLAVAVNSRQRRQEREEQFVGLAKWAPYIFVNPSDPVSAEYIGYFEHRENMAKIGAGKIQKLATQHSIGSLCNGSEPLHLLPTAYLTVNLSPSKDFKQAHGIHQWWKEHFQWQSKMHRFN